LAWFFLTVIFFALPDASIGKLPPSLHIVYAQCRTRAVVCAYTTNADFFAMIIFS